MTRGLGEAILSVCLDSCQRCEP